MIDTVRQPIFTDEQLKQFSNPDVKDAIKERWRLDHLEYLKKVIKYSNDKMEEHLGCAAYWAMRQGLHLNSAKDQLHHGEFTPWVIKNFYFINERTARKYRDLADHWDAIMRLQPAGTRIPKLSINQAYKIIKKLRDEKKIADPPSTFRPSQSQLIRDQRLQNVCQEFYDFVSKLAPEELEIFCEDCRGLFTEVLYKDLKKVVKLDVGSDYYRDGDAFVQKDGTPRTS